jgi:hypothetical protein
MFELAHVDFGIPRALPFYLLLGGICGVAAVASVKPSIGLKISSKSF